MSKAIRMALACAAAFPAHADVQPACRSCQRGCEMVMRHGGPDLDLAAVLDLNMRFWKPQSSHGIEILGWSAERLGDGRCAVSYTYREAQEVSIRWDVDLVAGSITAQGPLAERMQRMSEVLSTTTKGSQP